MKITRNSLAAQNFVVNTIAFSTWVPVVVPVAIEAADIPRAIWITFSIDHRAFATVASVHRKFSLWRTISESSEAETHRHHNHEDHLSAVHRPIKISVCFA